MKKAEKNIYPQLKELYIEAFPPVERAPFSKMVKRAEQNRGDFWCFYDGDSFVGMVYVIADSKLAYIFYLAMAPEKRGMGYGTKAIEEIKKKYAGRKIFLALEDVTEKDAPNMEQRLKRHKFYENCGLVDLPHKIKEGSMVYAIMGTGEAVSAHEYGSLMVSWAGKFYVKIFGIRIVE